MKTFTIIWLLFTAALGVIGIVSAVSGLYLLSSRLLLLLIVAEFFRKIIWTTSDEISLKFFPFIGYSFWFIATMSILLWKMFFNDYGIAGIIAVFVFIVSGLYWLSKNILIEKDNLNYSGFSLPAAVGILLSIIIFILQGNSELSKFYSLMVILTAVVSILMSVEIKYFNFVNLTVKTKIIWTAGLLIAAVLSFWTPLFLTIMFSFYIITPLIGKKYG